MTPHETMLAREKRPAVYVSRQENHPLSRRRKHCHAVAWVKIPAAPPTEQGYEAVLKAWQKHRDDFTGHVSWDDVAEATGMEVGMVAALVKGVWERDRSAVSTNINRMGDLTYFRINQPELFKTEPLPPHWTEQKGS